MLDKEKHKKLEESLYRKKRAFTVLFILFMLFTVLAASLGASLCEDTAVLVKSEDNTLTNDALACFALTTAMNFSFFVIFSAILYRVFFFMNPKSNNDSIKYSQKI